jgi:beta-glucosidase
VNQRGLDFYSRLIDTLPRARHHAVGDDVPLGLPQALEDCGGWRARGVTDAFATYADTIVQAYGDRVKNWITLNEIRCFTLLGYGGADKAPAPARARRSSTRLCTTPSSATATVCAPCANMAGAARAWA